MNRLQLLLICSFLFALGPHTFAQQEGSSPVKIFILAGQSNMVGHGEMSPATTPGTLEFIVANDPGDDYQFLLADGGVRSVRDDVWIRDQDGSAGGLTVGYGGQATTVGPELSFGHFAGDLYENQVLIVKAAWGGKSLSVDLRPPSSGGTTGFYYNEILRLVDEATTTLETYFPDYDAAGGYEIAGFCWHQGWNDRVTTAFTAEYETNMANFIQDIRSDLEVPGLPFVIATTGMDGSPSSYSETELAQLAMADTATYPQFGGNLAVVNTRIQYDGMDFWQSVEQSPRDQGFHWNRNAKTFVNIGLAMADAMSTLAPSRCPARLRATAAAPSGVSLNWQNGTETPDSVQVLRDSVLIATISPVDSPTYLDASAQPGQFDYQLVFDMPGGACDPLTITLDGGVTDLEAFRSPGGVGLQWVNNMVYDGIEIRRDGEVISASLAGDATNFTDTSPPASGSITYSVTPTNGSATPTDTQIDLEGPPTGNAVIYEPFDYPIGGVNSQSGNSEVGLDGQWNANNTTMAVVGSLDYGALPTGGASIGDMSRSQNRYGGACAIRSTALAGNGLLDDGATLWFSLVMGYGTGGNLTNSTLAFALANNQFNAANFRYFIDDEAAQLGSGVGVTLGRISNVNGRTVATHFQDGSFGRGFASNVRGTWERPPGTEVREGEHALIVGKIVWGADSDVIELYHPNTDLNLGSVTSNLTVNVDQSTFDTITFSRGDVVTIDEIRFGASYDDVIGTADTNDYDTWAALFPATDLSDQSAELDSDGLSNGEERIWGLDPTDPSSPTPYLSTLGVSGTVIYTRRARHLTGLSYKVWTSADVVEWVEDTEAVQTPAPSGSPDVDKVTVTLSRMPPATGKLFLRIQAVE